MRTAAEKLKALGIIQGRPTTYELAVTAPDGTRALAGYTQHGKPGIRAMIERHAAAWRARAGAGYVLVYASDGRTASLGALRFDFTGRTRRQAIIEGELPWFKDVLPEGREEGRE